MDCPVAHMPIATEEAVPAPISAKATTAHTTWCIRAVERRPGHKACQTAVPRQQADCHAAALYE